MWGVDWQPGGRLCCWCYPWSYLWKWLAKANARWRAAGSSLLNETFPRKHKSRWRQSSLLGYLPRFTVPGLLPPNSWCCFSLISGWNWWYTCWSRCDLLPCPRGWVVERVSGKYPLQQFAMCVPGIPLPWLQLFQVFTLHIVRSPCSSAVAENPSDWLKNWYKMHVEVTVWLLVEVEIIPGLTSFERIILYCLLFLNGIASL